MDKDPSPSLFDLSGGSKKKPTTNAPPKTEPKRSTPSAEEAKQNLKKMQEMHTQLVQKMEAAFQKAGVDPKTLSSYCENPNNFTPDQWRIHLQKLQKTETTITGLTPDKIEQNKEKKADARSSKERRGKTLGSRKNWLNMH